MATDTTTYEGIDANIGLLMATLVAWILAIVGAIPVVRSLDAEADSALLSFALVLVVLFLGTLALPIRRFTASVSDLEFRFSRGSAVSWMIGRAPEVSVVQVSEIRWVRVDRNPWGDGVIVIQSAASRFRIPIGRFNARAVAFSDALKRLATSGSGSRIEVRPNWWSTSSGRTSCLAIALLSLATAISAVFIDMDAKLRANVVLGGLVLCGFALYSLYTLRKS